MPYQLALAALADPTRRGIYERLRRRPYTVGELARAARISQPAASQHLRVLRAAKLVDATSAGTKRLYAPRQEGLDALRRYVDALWFDILAAHATGEHEIPLR